MKVTPAPCLLAAAVAVMGVFVPNVGEGQGYAGKYAPCVDYYTVGQSPCQPLASTPLQPAPHAAAVAPAQAEAAPVSAEEQKIDAFLENYGKPPKEFVAFYLNPTQENAMKWVAAYRQMVERSQALSRSWSQADALYQQGLEQGAAPAARTASGLPPVQDLGAALPQDHLRALQTAQQAASKPPASVHLGAFAEKGGFGGLSDPVHLTYYYSATCPFCAKMTPVLNSLFNEMAGKLALTCVDVTPLSNTHRPDPANIEGKLACNWRVPEEGEIEQAGVAQTPTMVISRGDAAPLRLSGFVPAEKMREYLGGAPAGR